MRIILLLWAVLVVGCAVNRATQPPGQTRINTPAPSVQSIEATRTPTAPPISIPVASASPIATRTRTPTRLPTNTPLPKGKVTKIDSKVRSTLLDMDRRLIIYLPPGYNDTPQRRYPVLYLLHGYGGCNDKLPEWEVWGLKDQLEALTLNGTIQPMMVVLPDGFMPDCQPSYFFNHQPGVTDGKPWADYIWGEVVSYIDKTYRTLARRESRAIGGYSLGGQGALSLAFLHPKVYLAVGAHSPSFRGADGSIPFINDWNWYNQYDPIWLAENTDKPRQLAIWIDVGKDDDKVRYCGHDSNRCVEGFRAILLARNIVHDWQGDWLGRHEGPTYWGPHIPDYLKWYSSQLLGQ